MALAFPNVYASVYTKCIIYTLVAANSPWAGTRDRTEKLHAPQISKRR